MISIFPFSYVLLGLYWVRWLIWKRKELPLVVPVLFTCFFMPKQNLMMVSYLSTAGLRVDDFLTLILLIVAIMDPATYRNKAVRWGFGMLIVLSVVNLLSVFVGRLLGYGNQLLLPFLMVARKFEYGAYVLIGIFTARRLKNPYRDFYGEFTWLSVLYMIPAALQLMGKVTYVVTGQDLGDTMAGTASSTFNGYYEYGMFLCFGCAVYACDLFGEWERAKIWKTSIPVSLVMLPLTFGMLALSQSRSSLVIGFLIILAVIWLPLRSTVSRAKLIVGGYGGIAILAGITVVLTGIVGFELSGRLGDFGFKQMGYWGELLARGNFSEYVGELRGDCFEFNLIDKLGYLNKVSDWSEATRLLKWGAALDGFRQNPLLGYGFGITHVMDGNYIRLLGETGLLGTALWFVFYGGMMRFMWKLRETVRMARPVFLMMVSIALAAIMLDMFDASKPMEMMWLMFGGVLAAEHGLRRVTRTGSP